MNAKNVMTPRKLSEVKRELLASLLEDEGIELSPRILPREDPSEAPLSFAQQRLWLVCQMEPESPFYNIHSAALLEGEFRVPALEQALSEIMNRHDVLRATFTAVDGQPLQIIGPSQKQRFPIVDLSALSGDDRRAGILTLPSHYASRPFNLSSGPLLRVTLILLKENECLLLLTMHHIVSDAWSMSILFKEMVSFYEAFSNGRPLSLGELPIQYADYAAWQREWLSGDVLEGQLQYWKRQLGGSLPALRLPTDKPRTALQSHSASMEPVVFPKPIADLIRASSRQYDVTPFMLLLSAFSALLQRYSRQDEALIGSPVANRNRTETEGLIGFFINALVLRVNLSKDPNFEQLLNRTREVILGAFAHQDLPFDMLVMELQPERNFSHMPLFQVAFSLENGPTAPVEIKQLNITRVASDTGAMPYDLNLTLLDSASGFWGTLGYNTDLFDQLTIKVMISHFTTLLEDAISNPKQKISDLTLLNEKQMRQVVTEFNQTNRDYPINLLQDFFRKQVELSPDAVAVVFNDEQVTYYELNRRANRLAQILLSRSVAGPDKVVAICLERSIEMVVAVLGVLKSGSAYLPLEPSYPQQRISYILTDCSASIVLTDSSTLWQIDQIEAEFLCLDMDPVTSLLDQAEPPSPNVSPDNLAYVIYTSGTTGRPKGVMISHRSIGNRLMWLDRELGFTDQEVVLQKTSYGFDASVWEMLLPLIKGAKLVMAEPWGHQDSDYLVKELRRQQVTTLQLAPSMLRMLVEEAGLKLCGGLRRIFCGGEALTREDGEKLSKSLEVELHNLYGPTETSIDATHWWCEKGNNSGILPIGKAIGNVKVYLLDERMKTVGVGMEGEICIGGVGLARGYIGKAHQTAEKFLPNPYGEQPGERIYRSGDVGRHRGEGVIEYVGRADDQVKIRGNRVELGEIESVLRECEGVIEAAVALREDQPGDQRLVAYVVMREGGAEEELRISLGERLPEYMQLSAIVKLERMPVTTGGKIDRKALPAPKESETQHSEKKREARGEIEEIVTSIWEEVLGKENMSAEDNFFDQGGHSLLALQVGSRVRKVFGVELTVRRMFENATVEGMAHCIEQELRGGKWEQAPLITTVSRDQELPLSFAQQRLWFIDQLEPGNPLYNIAMAIRFTGPLNIISLEQSFSGIIRRHEALRTTFSEMNRRPSQVIAPPSEFRLKLVDLTTIPAGEKQQVIKALARGEAGKGFDLKYGPLMRVALLKEERQNHILLFTIHHIVSDEWSTGILIREMNKMYEEFSNGKPVGLSELKVQYADYAVWQSEWLTDEVLETQLRYWEGQLAGARYMLDLPTDHPRSTVRRHNGRRESIFLSETLSAGLKSLCRTEGGTLFMILLTAYKVLLHYLSKQQSILVGTSVANRARLEIEDLIGFFANTLVIRADLSGDSSFRELHGKVREACLGAYAHQDLPFEKLVAHLQPERNMSTTPLFQVMFVYQNIPASTVQASNLRLSNLESDWLVAKFELLLEMMEVGQCLAGSITYNAELFDASTIVRMLAQFETILNQVVACPDIKLSAILEILADADHSEKMEIERQLEQASLTKLKNIRRRSIVDSNLKQR
jgi:amino acid adenylation domain-containing protein